MNVSPPLCNPSQTYSYGATIKIAGAKSYINSNSKISGNTKIPKVKENFRREEFLKNNMNSLVNFSSLLMKVQKLTMEPLIGAKSCNNNSKISGNTKNSKVKEKLPFTKRSFLGE